MVPSQTGKKAEQAAAAAIVSHPVLSLGATRFMELEREVEHAYRPLMLQALEEKVQAERARIESQAPQCVRCGQAMKYHDRPKVSWLSRFGKVRTPAARFRCAPCHYECRPLLDHLGVEPGRISGSLARLLVLLTVIAPYELAARLAFLLLGVKVSALGVWRVTQRLGEAAARYQEEVTRYHSDSRSPDSPAKEAAEVVVVGVDGDLSGRCRYDFQPAVLDGGAQDATS